MTAQRGKPPVGVDELPSQCRTWDHKRRVWVPKARYASDREAAKAAPKGQQSYRCKATSVGVHFHTGHPSKGTRR